MWVELSSNFCHLSNIIQPLLRTNSLYGKPTVVFSPHTPCGRVRLARFTLEDHAYGASRLPKTTVLQSNIVLAVSLLNFWWSFFVTILKDLRRETMPCQPLCKFLWRCAFLPVEAFSKLLEILSACQSLPSHALSTKSPMPFHKNKYTSSSGHRRKQRLFKRRKRGFYDKGGFPGVIGCVDGTHVKIQGPTENENDYRRLGTIVTAIQDSKSRENSVIFLL